MRTFKLKKNDVIYNTLEREIRNGKYMLGYRLPSDLELSQRFSASRPTVARALRELEAAGLVERKVGSGTFVKHDSIFTKKRLIFGLLIPGLGETEIFDQICGHLSHLADMGNFKILWYGSMDSGPQERAARLEQLALRYIEEKVDGVFFAPLELTKEKDAVNIKIAEMFRKQNIAVVLMDRDIVDFPCRSDFDLIAIDNFRVGYIMTEHLAKQGCKRIDFLARPYSAPSVDMRIAGYQEALRKSRIPFEGGNLIIGEPLEKETVEKLIESKPDGILCANDSTAAKLVQALSRAKIDMPSQVMLAGVDDIAYSKYLTPTLTTYRQPCLEIATTAVRVMIDRIEEPNLPTRTTQLMGELIVRESTKR